jgi:hypothetical protein
MATTGRSDQGPHDGSVLIFLVARNTIFLLVRLLPLIWENVMSNAVGGTDTSKADAARDAALAKQEELMIQSLEMNVLMSAMQAAMAASGKLAGR